MFILSLKSSQKKISGIYMFRFMFFILFFPFFIVNSFANDIPPSTIVDDLVNVTTGHLYLNKTDAIAVGKEPLLFTRKYLNPISLNEVSQDDLIYPNEIESEEYKLSGWSFLKHAKAYIKIDKGGRRLDIYDSNGSVLRFSFPKLDKKIKDKTQTLSLRNVFMGFSEVGNAITAASNNYRNVKVILNTDKDLTVYLANGVIRRYHRSEGSDNNFLLQEEILKNGNRIIYEHADHLYITKITTLSPNNKVLSSIKIHHNHADWKRKNNNDEKKDKYDFFITTNHGQNVHYLFNNYQILLDSKGKRHNKYLFYLEEFRTDDHIEKMKYDLDYKRTNPLLNEYNLPDGRFFKIKYYLRGDKNPEVGIVIDDKDDRFQRVSAIESFDSVNKPKYRFFYNFAKLYKHGGSTAILDYYDNKTVYYYSNKLRVQKIEKYKDDSLHHFETFFWGKDDTNEEGFYKGSVFCDEQKRRLHALINIYDEDKKGNIEKKIIYGNLTGLSQNFITLDKEGLPTNTDVETYTKRFEYNKDNLLIKEIDEDGVSIEYGYKTNTNLLESKFIKYNNKIKQRFFYAYNNENFLIEEISDDGSSSDKEDLFNVTRRLIKKIIPNTSANFYGFISSVEEKYLDLNTKKEKLLKKEAFQYSPKGKIRQKDVYDANNHLRHSLKYSYDEKGNLETETDPLGRTAAYKHDANSNKIYEKDFSGKVTHFRYDQNNRLIEKTLKAKEAENGGYITRYQYDVNNNLLSEIDPRGNVTNYKYDAFGNVIKKTLPSVLDENKDVKQKAFEYEYDALNRVVKEITPTKDEITKKYNYYGKPTYIKHPDGTIEKFVYNKNGTLKRHVNQIGTVTEYEYDYQKRAISKKIFSSNGEKLFEENFEYSAFELISHIDNAGNTTKYGYDFAGRKILEEKFSSDQKLISKEEYFYNELGFLDKTVQGNLLEIQYKLDLLGKVLEEKRLNLKNQVLYKIGYEYDLSDRQSCIKNYVNDQEQKKYLFYDELDRLVKTINPVNNTETIKYNDFYKNELNQKVKQKTLVNALGQKTVITYDTIGREIKIEEKSPKDKILSIEEKFYDLNDNLILQESTIFDPDGSSRKVTTSWIYDNMNRLIKLTEAKNSKEEKETSYTYSPTGLLLKTIKPDSSVLENTYDELSNRIETKSSDGFIHYTFSYNGLNQCIFAKDFINDETITRKYDLNNNLLEERLANGLVIAHEYDLLGNRIKTVYPDKSLSEYIYDPVNLKKVIRTDKNNSSYEHTFDKYDLDGNLLEETLINKSKIITHIDGLARIKSIRANNFTQRIKSYDSIGRIKGIETKTSSYENKSDFSYDDLNQLIKETGLFDNSYSYDSHNNRLSKNEDEYKVNDLNELLDTSKAQYEYDKNGRPYIKRTEEGDIHFSYDALDRLIKVEVPNQLIISFSYDAFHRRTKKISQKKVQSYFGYESWESTKETYIYDDQNEIGSVDKNNQIKTFRVLADTADAEIGSAISFEINNKVYAPVYDFQGNVASLQDLHQKEAESYSYSAFGEKRIYDNSNQEIEVTYVRNPWQYLSKRLDEETNLVFFGRRYYDPEIGRWLTPDPKGFEDGLNLYAYVLNDPLIRLDLYGLEINDNDSSKLHFPNAEQSLFCNFNLNFNLNFDTYWKWMLFMKMQNMQFLSFQKESVFNKNFYWGINALYNVGDFSFNFALGAFEGATGIEVPYTSSDIGVKGRNIGRKEVDYSGKILMAKGFIDILEGLSAGIGGPLLMLSGIGAVPGAVLTTGSAILIGKGLLELWGGYVLYKKFNQNYDKLSKLESSSGKGKIEFKRPKSHISGKEGAKDVPSWAKGNRPYKHESGKDFAKRLLDEKYGRANYKKGPKSDFNRIKKWGDRAFE